MSVTERRWATYAAARDAQYEIVLALSHLEGRANTAGIVGSLLAARAAIATVIADLEGDDQ